jgi:hypothetical protein
MELAAQPAAQHTAVAYFTRTNLVNALVSAIFCETNKCERKNNTQVEKQQF